MLTLTWPQVLAFRMQRHFLEERAPQGSLLEVVSRVCGLHAQVMSSAEIAAAARIDGLGRDEVSAALWQDRALVKAWFMRSTLHLITAADFPLYLGAMSDEDYFHHERWLKGFGVTPDDMNAILEGIRVVLPGASLTREQLADAVAGHAGRPHLRAVLMRSFGAFLKPGTVQGLLIFGPSRGQNVTFVDPHHWLGDFPALEPHESKLETVRRFLAAYGPSTSNDFASWRGIGRSGAKKLFKALGDELSPVSIEGRDAFALAVDAAALQSIKPSRAVRLLPAFDPYILGFRREPDSALAQALWGRVFRQQGWISAVVLVGGRVVGVWKHELKGARLTITIDPFEPLTQTVRAGIDQEAARLGQFLAATAAVTYPE